MPIIRTRQFLLLMLTCCLFTTTRLAAQKPLVDPKDSNPVQTLSTEELNKIPGPRNVMDLIKVTPSTAASNYTSSIGEATGVNFVKLAGANDKIIFYLPNQIFEGQSFTGTMTVQSGPGAETQSRQFIALWKDGIFQWSDNRFDGEIVKQGSGEFWLNLTSKENNLRYTFGVRIQPGNYVAPASSQFPTSGTSGNPLQILGPSGGVLPPNTYFKIGGMPAPILTSTVGSIVIQNNYNTPGLTEIETNINNTVQRYKFRNITLRLSADKTNLVKGETTALRIEVAGLENLRAPAAMSIDATGMINMAGGNSQKFLIPTSAIGADGIYRLGKTLTGTAAGGFGVKVTVVVDKEDF